MCIIQKISDVLKSEHFDCAFVCSDNLSSKNKMIEYLKKFDLNIISHNSNVVQNEGDNAMPWSAVQVDKNLLAKEVIIEIYLMSKCHSIIRTNFSGVSQISVYLNPNIIHYSV